MVASAVARLEARDRVAILGVAAVVVGGAGV